MARKAPNIPTAGMSNSHPMNLKDNEYPLMLNGNIQTDINGPVTLTNEHSNYLCNRFPEGYKVIGELYVPESFITYVWLVNPSVVTPDGGYASQIGFLKEYVLIESTDREVQDPCDGCGVINKESIPLEDTEQAPLCEYTCIVTSDCLNFNINFPIRKAVYKKDNCGSTLYFTDFNNPIRALKLTPDNKIDNVQRFIDHYEGECDTPCVPPRVLNSDCECVDASGNVQQQCTCCEPFYNPLCTDEDFAGEPDIDCVKLRLFPQVAHICIEPEAVIPGGTLQAGTYQLAACYADQNGERATRTFSCSNPISVFDPGQILNSQTDYPTGLAVKFSIKDLDSSLYRFIDVFVVATINSVAQYRQYETIDISSLVKGTLEYTVSDLQKGKDVSIDDILQIFPVYEKAQEITSAGNTLLLANLTGPRDLNLQQAVNGLSHSIRWVTSEANEWFYADGVNAGKHRSYLRDEVYPLGIVFERNNTLDTCAYPLIGRALNTAFLPILDFKGPWIPTMDYAKAVVLNDIPASVVYHNGVFYAAVENSGPSTTVVEPPNAFYWQPVDQADILCGTPDDHQENGPDVFKAPGCEHEKAGGGQPTYDLRWQVYNTACNYGETCDPLKSTAQCVDESEVIHCRSFRYTVPTACAVWEASTGPYPQNITFTLTVDPTTLGIYNGAAITSKDHPLPAGTIINGPIVPGNTITVQVQSAITAQGSIDASGVIEDCVTISFNIDCDASGVTCDTDILCNPLDCYIDEINKCLPCASNYPTLLADVAHCEPSACGCPAWPPVGSDVSGTCHDGYVRTKSDIMAYYQANGEYLLCIDATVVGYSDTLADPFVIKTDSTPVKLIDASTKPWYVYDILNIQSLIIDPKDPTKDFMVGTKGPEDPVCLQDLFQYPITGQIMLGYMFPSVNMPDTEPENYEPNNGIGTFNPSPENKCNDYGPTAPLMYMLGYDLTAPSSSTCCGGVDEDCYWASGDYWGLGTPTAITNEVNNNKYQSYWYSFVATALQPTIIIKSKIGYKFGTFVGAGHVPDTTTVGSKDFQEQGDFRIDVYEGDFNATPTWSTGQAPIPATYYYTGGYEDQGVLVIGDVANSTGLATTAGQIPLIPGTTYYVHIYLLQQGIEKVEKAPLANPAKTDECISYDPPDDCDPCGSCCPCYFANYAYMNLCMNSATSGTTKVVSLPETWQVDCTYTVFYRHPALRDHGCLLQTFEYGAFAFWESENHRYPNNKEVWGDLCQQPIRHFKFPDVLVSKLQDQDPLIDLDINGNPTGPGPFNSQRTAKIYPLSFRVDAEDVKAWLRWASLPVSQGGGGLMTDEERLSITGYKLVRGNRVGNKSIVAKGLLWDMWNYKEHDYVNNSYSNIKTYYANYPFNDLRIDPYLEKGGTNFTPPSKHDRWAFLSPDTTFNTPFLGTELKFESVNFGDALGNFYTVRSHPKYVLLSGGGIALASTLAGIQLAGDLLISLGTLLGQFDVGFSNTIPVGSIVGFVGEFLNLAPKFFIYAKQWRDIVIGFGVPQNFAKYYAAVGNFHSSGALGEVQNAGNKRRVITNSTYLLAGNLGTSDDGVLSKINNYQREDSVYLFCRSSITAYPDILSPTGGSQGWITGAKPWFADTSRFIMSDGSFDDKPCNLIDRQSNVAAFYASMKYYVPDQYGAIHDIEWLYTGTCVSIDWEFKQPEEKCNPVFGGDTFICRMSQKRKLPFFLDNPVGAATGVDFQYQRISNITDAVYFFNSVGESAATSSNIQFRPVEHKFDEPCAEDSNLYLKGSMYLFNYGIASFICESDFNLNYRYALDTKGKDFYPHQSDIENWTQEIRVPIETPNGYFYNRTYSKQNKENFFCTQPVLYSNAECITTYKNRVINSIPDEDSDFYTDPWRIFLANDYHDFPLTNGQLVGMDGIEKEKVILRFNNTTLVFNAYYTMTTDAGVAQIGTASMFAQKPLEYAKTSIGYGGTQHHAFTSTQFGHFWIDAKKSNVFMLPPGSGLEEISMSLNTFFNNNLPFFILKAFPNFPVDNNYKDIGITLGWDNKFDRLLITKLDYELKPMWYQSASPTDYVDYSDASGFFHCDPSGCTSIELIDPKYFCNKSWTVGYSPITKTWISYYSFVPNYYISHDNYFQTGINYPQSGDSSEAGLWNHLISNKSYQVFYGKLNPFITDVVVKDELINKQLHSIEYQADFLRFQNDYDYFYNTAVTFNKMVIWSENRNSGNLELVPQLPDNMAQGLLYPRSNANSTTVLVTRKENNWRVNQFFDLVKNKQSNVPPMVYNCHPYLKTVNPLAIDYFKPTFQRSRFTSDYFTLRFINDEYSNYKIINKWFLNNTIKSDT